MKDCFFLELRSRTTATDCGKYAEMLFFLCTPFLWQRCVPFSGGTRFFTAKSTMYQKIAFPGVRKVLKMTKQKSLYLTYVFWTASELWIVTSIGLRINFTLFTAEMCKLLRIKIYKVCPKNHYSGVSKEIFQIQRALFVGASMYVQ